MWSCLTRRVRPHRSVTRVTVTEADVRCQRVKRGNAWGTGVGGIRRCLAGAAASARPSARPSAGTVVIFIHFAPNTRAAAIV